MVGLMLICSVDIYNWTSHPGQLRETKPLLARVIWWNSLIPGAKWAFFGCPTPFLHLPWPPHQGDGGGQSYIKSAPPWWPGHSNSSCGQCCRWGCLSEEEFPHLKANVQCTVGFYLAVHFPWTFTGHFSTPLHPSPVRTKDGFAASRTCWYFTKIDTKIGVLMIHQNGDSTISSQHLKRNKARLKTSSTASKQVYNFLSFP